MTRVLGVLVRTASIVNRALARVVEPYGLSLAQYNALRIIRGAGSGGIPTLSIRERMIEEGTTITRLLDKLEEAGLIQRERYGGGGRVRVAVHGHHHLLRRHRREESL